MSKIRELREQHVDVVEAAKREAEKILKEAEIRAAKIVGSAEIVADKNQKEWEKRLEIAMAERLREYDRVLQNVSKSVEKNAAQDIRDFTVGAQKSLTEKLAKGDAKIEEEIQQVRADRIKRLDVEMGNVIERVTREVLGKALSLTEHRELVIKALEEAKGQHVL